MHSQFTVSNSEADCSSETQGVLVSIGELNLCTACACIKCLDETKWSDIRIEMPRRSGLRPRQGSRFRIPRPRRDVSASPDSLETSRTRPHPWLLCVFCLCKMFPDVHSRSMCRWPVCLTRA